LGTGYSGISVANGTLYTMYRTASDAPAEYTVAIDVESGATLWEHAEEAIVPDSVVAYGHVHSGPNSTPLVLRGRVFSVGRNGTLIAFDAKSGKTLWKQQLDVDFWRPDSQRRIFEQPHRLRRPRSLAHWSSGRGLP